LGFAAGDFGTILKTADYGVWESSLQKRSTLQIYPNPAHDRIVLDLPVSVNSGIVDILTISGRLLKTVQMSGQNACIHISELPEGLYLLNFKGKTSKLSGKFVKLK